MKPKTKNHSYAVFHPVRKAPKDINHSIVLRKGEREPYTKPTLLGLARRMVARRKKNTFLLKGYLRPGSNKRSEMKLPSL